MAPQEKKRIEYIDLAKGVCISFVVLYHVMNGFDLHDYPGANAMRVFRMPLYFFLSGLFFKPYENYIGFLKRKINKLLIPFFAFYFLTVIPFEYICCAIGRKELSEVGISPFYNWFLEIFNTNTPLWFLLCLFVLNNIFYLIYGICSKITKQHATILLCLGTLVCGGIGYFLGMTGTEKVVTFNLPSYIDTACTAMPFFAAGYVAKKCYEWLTEKSEKPLAWVAIVLFVLSLFLFGNFENFRTQEYRTNIIELYLCGLAGIFSILFFCKKVNYIPFISYCGRYSIIILVTHRQIVYGLCEGAKLISSNLAITIPVVFLITMIICGSLIPVMKKYMGYVTAQRDLIPVGK